MTYRQFFPNGLFFIAPFRAKDTLLTIPINGWSFGIFFTLGATFPTLPLTVLIYILWSPGPSLDNSGPRSTGPPLPESTSSSKLVDILHSGHWNARGGERGGGRRVCTLGHKSACRRQKQF